MKGENMQKKAITLGLSGAIVLSSIAPSLAANFDLHHISDPSLNTSMVDLETDPALMYKVVSNMDDYELEYNVSKGTEGTDGAQGVSLRYTFGEIERVVRDQGVEFEEALVLIAKKNAEEAVDALIDPDQLTDESQLTDEFIKNLDEADGLVFTAEIVNTLKPEIKINGREKIDNLRKKVLELEKGEPDEDLTIEEQIDKALEKAEQSLARDDYDKAKGLIDTLDDGDAKDAYLERLAKIEKSIELNETINDAKNTILDLRFVSVGVKNNYIDKIEKTKTIDEINKLVEEIKALDKENGEQAVLATGKDQAKSFIDSLKYLGRSEKLSFYNEIDKAKSDEEINEIQEKANKLNSDRGGSSDSIIAEDMPVFLSRLTNNVSTKNREEVAKQLKQIQHYTIDVEEEVPLEVADLFIEENEDYDLSFVNIFTINRDLQKNFETYEVEKLKDLMIEAFKYEYKSESGKVYEYNETVTIEGNTFKGTYGMLDLKPESHDGKTPKIIADLARYLGGIKRADSSIAKSIVFEGEEYFWNEEKGHTGSNWYNEETSLVSAIASRLADSKQISFSIYLNSERASREVFFEIDIKAELEDTEIPEEPDTEEPGEPETEVPEDPDKEASKDPETEAPGEDTVEPGPEAPGEDTVDPDSESPEAPDKDELPDGKNFVINAAKSALKKIGF